MTEEHGFALLFISPLHGSLARALDRATVDGILAVGLDERHPEMSAIRRAGVPAVVVDAPAWPGHQGILVDDEGGARLAAEHLVALGHRQFLVLGIEAALDDAGDSDDGVTGRRLSGYRSALAPAGVELSPEQVMRPAATIEGGESAFLRAWSRGQRPTGVLCMSDAAAAGVLGAARRLGIRVPEELSIVGFDDLPLTRFTDPPLTTVHQPVRQKGEEAATMLLEALRRPSSGDQDRQRILGHAWWSAAPRRHRPAIGVWRWSQPVSTATTIAAGSEIPRAAPRGGTDTMSRKIKAAGLLATLAIAASLTPAAAQSAAPLAYQGENHLLEHHARLRVREGAGDRTGSVMISIPVMVFFFMAQRYLISGLASGGVKG